MSAAYKEEAGVASDPFGQSRTVFEELLARTSTSRALAASHAEVEEDIGRSGRALLRQLFQDHLDLRHSQERRVVVRDERGVQLPERRRARRQLRSLLGPVTVARFLYQEGGREGRAPADARLRLCDDGYSMGVRREVAQLCARDAYAPALETLERLTGAHVPQRQAEQLVRRAAEDVASFYERRTQEPVPREPLLILSFDAAGIVMRTDSLRDDTRKKALAEPRERAFPPKLKSGEKPNRKRMAQLGSVYQVAPFIRTADDIVGELQSLTKGGSTEPRPSRPRPLNKRVFGSIAKVASSVIDEGFREALSRDPQRKRRWIVLLDGNDEQLQAVKRAARRCRASIAIVVDLIHLIEYLWSAAYCFHPAGSDDARDWVVQRVRSFLTPGADPAQLAAGMRRSATRRSLERRTAVDDCAAYILKLAPYMRYGEAIALGLPIATGVIEGACRHLVRRRLGIGGARGSTAGAEAILLLRATVLSEDFDAYWQHHENEVFRRTHGARYRGPIPERVRSVDDTRDETLFQGESSSAKRRAVDDEAWNMALRPKTKLRQSERLEWCFINQWHSAGFLCDPCFGRRPVTFSESRIL